ncbi:sodium/potassium-transporting ATPase subunit beta-1-interacting protein 3-like isoform X2 [Xiphophorus couchianus]|uniref:sodium/potassium-transporting ATPase subunit beta-1-interacting protein 3-like isoform X2 n=1 Tax=Xiphophorus couchianus TaxID=32473 RepID=UPI001016F69C|nr:sodium/potassium-transporting ATPase subunit beta-1-interacting protein 3-like isoform X2 [Xiphophorus couchianus]
MACCSGRCMLVLLCCVQLIIAVERQVFDFLGYQWAPIMVNFFHIVAVILGLFGAIQYQSRYVTMYLLWMFVWIGWNVFVSCLYLDLGGLSKDSHILSLGISSHSSWWKNNGPGCQSQNLPSDRWNEHQNPQLASVPSCWLQYQYLEVLHCAAQLLLSLLGVVCSCHAVSRFPEEENYYK